MSDTVTHKLKLNQWELDAVARGLHLLRTSNYWGGVVDDELGETIDSATAKVARAKQP